MAKLSLLHAQVEPHFLYNTLASAQVLTRSDPARADQMLGHLITYLRRSLPARRGFAVDAGRGARARARLPRDPARSAWASASKLQIQVPESLRAVPMPPMMLQTLVENAIKHGLEPVPGGGTIWILAREAGRQGRGHGGRRRPRLQRGRRRHRHRAEERARAPAARLRRRGVVRDRAPTSRRAWRRRSPCRGGPAPACLSASSPKTRRSCATSCVAQLGRAWPELEIVAACEDGGVGAGGDRRPQARRRLPRHPHAGPHRPRGRGRGRRTRAPRRRSCS